MGILSREKVHECLRIQKQRHGGVQIGQIFFELGLVDENQLQTALAAQRGMEYIDVNGIDIYPGLLGLCILVSAAQAKYGGGSGTAPEPCTLSFFVAASALIFRAIPRRVRGRRN